MSVEFYKNGTIYKGIYLDISREQIFDLQNYGVPQLVFTIAGYVIVACATLGLAAQITKKDSNDTN